MRAGTGFMRVTLNRSKAAWFWLEMAIMAPDWLLTGVWFLAGVSATGAFWHFLSQKNYHGTLWSGYATLIIALLAIALHIRNDLIRREAEEARAPRFSEAIKDLRVSFGRPNAVFSMSYDALKRRKTPFAPAVFGTYRPIQLSVIDDRIQLDTVIYDRHGSTAIELKKNKLVTIPPGWETNYDKDALEVVDYEQRPVFQCYFITASQLIIKGFFRSNNNQVIVVSDSGLTYPPDQPLEAYTITRIFRYPSRKFPGQRE